MTMTDTPEQEVTVSEADAFLASLSDAPASSPAPAVEAAMVPVERPQDVMDAVKRIQLEAGASEAIAGALSDEDALAWGSKLDKRGKGFADALMGRAEALKELEALKAQRSEPQEATTVGEHATPTPSPVDLLEKEKVVAEWLGMDDEASAALDAWRSAIAETIRAEIRQEYGGLGDRVSATESLAVSRLMDESRANLAGSFPVLNNPETFSEVEKLMGTFHKAGMYQEMDTSQRFASLMRTAAVTLTPEAAPPIESEADQAAKLSGSPTKPTPSKERKGATARLTADQELDLRIQMIQQGATADEVIRKFG
jgi:hypothetical protein